MKTILKVLLHFALIIWEFPQTLLGVILLGIYRPSQSAVLGMKGYPDRIFYYTDNIPAGISLGNIIILRPKSKTIDHYHEYGHSKQSLFLGPLYLLVIGLPSILWNIHCRRDSSADYYSFYTEKWADRLGNVDRSKKKK